MTGVDATMGPATRDRVATEWRPTVTFVISVTRSCFINTLGKNAHRKDDSVAKK